MESNAARAVSSGCRGGSAAGLFPMLNPLGRPRGGHGEWAEWLGGQRGVAFHKATPSKLVTPIPEERASPASSSPSATPSPRLWFLEPSRSLVTGHRAAHTAWVLPAMTVFCPPPEMPPVAPSHPRPRCRHPLLTQRAGSPPCSVPPAPRHSGPGRHQAARSLCAWHRWHSGHSLWGRGLSCASGPDVWSPAHLLPL